MKRVFDYLDEETYLAHHGVKGQHWGVRRYQNPDGSYTEAGKKRYFNADGTLNYRGLQKSRKDAIDKDPYGHPTGRGYAGTTAEQRRRKVRDQWNYGDKGVKRIQDRMSTGRGYYQARRPEKIRKAAKLAAFTAASLAYYDIVLNDGKGISKVANAALLTGKKAVNNMAGVYGKMPIARAKFDDKMLKKVFG